MKYFLPFIFLIVGQIANCQGIEFFQGTWEETLAEASEQNKLIFVDAYAVWCGPCKKMTKQVFPQQKVGEYFNQHFVSLKMDMERGEGPKFGREYPVRAYPTFLFISPAGEVVLSVTGFRQAEAFIEIARKAVERYDPSTELAKQYEEGDRSFETVLAYVQALNQSGKSSIAVSNQFLRENEDLSEEQRLVFIYEAATESDSRLFDMLIENRPAIAELKTNIKVNERIAHACSNTVNKAIEFGMVELLREAQTKYKNCLPMSADGFIAESDLKYSSETGHADLFMESAKNILSQNESSEQYDLICNLVFKHFADQAEVVVFTEKIAKKGYKKFESPESGYNYARILQLAGESDKALQIINKLLSTLGEKPNPEILQLKEELLSS